MTIFAVLMPTPQPEVVARIKSEFKDDHYEVTPTQWLVSTTGTALEVTKRLGIFNPDDAGEFTGLGIVFTISSYHGRAPVPIWEWIKVKLEGRANGKPT